MVSGFIEKLLCPPSFQRGRKPACCPSHLCWSVMWQSHSGLFSHQACSTSAHWIVNTALGGGVCWHNAIDIYGWSISKKKKKMSSSAFTALSALPRLLLILQNLWSASFQLLLISFWWSFCKSIVSQFSYLLVPLRFIRRLLDLLLTPTFCFSRSDSPFSSIEVSLMLIWTVLWKFFSELPSDWILPGQQFLNDILETS